MTIKDLPILTSVQAHWLNSKPLDNDLAIFIQSTEYYKETRAIPSPVWWKMHENKLAQLLKFNSSAHAVIKESSVNEYGQDIVNNAHRYMSNIAKRNNIQPVSLQYATIAWFVSQIIDIDKTKELNKWDWEVKP